MKNFLKKSKKWLIAIIVIFITLVSCEKQKYVDADYPDQLIYMPAAVKGNFIIDAVALPRGSVPTAGNVYRYKIDTIGRKFIVPLAAYRSGINNDGEFKVNISIDADTITQLIASPKPKLPAGTLLLPSDKYSIVSSVDMLDGEELAMFDLVLDLDFFLDNYPGGIYAIGVGISSTARASNPLFSTTIVVVNTKMMKPTASFTTSTPADIKVRNFTNTSQMAISYKWNFGDGTAVSTEKSILHTYAAAGTYTVTLQAIGATGYQERSTTSTVITVL